jgi:hypothetical protein
MHDQDTYSRTRAPAGTVAGGGAHEAADAGSKAAVVADTAKETAKDEARAVAATAKQDAGTVVDEARSQVRRLASQARDQATERVHGSHHQLVNRLRGLADEFQEMGKDGDTPGKALVNDLGQRGRRVADYLADRGPEGLLSEVTDFARRRPLAFLTSAVAAGFLIGRLGKGVWKAKSDAGPTRSVMDSNTGSPAAYREPTVGAPQWTEPPPASGIARVGSTPADAPVTPAIPGASVPPVVPAPAARPAAQPNGPVAEPFVASPYPVETYDDPHPETQPRRDEPR